jgi:hypothetical protein
VPEGAVARALGRGPDGAAAGPEARRGLAARVRPLVLAHERSLTVPGPLGDVLDGGLVRGSVVVVDGAVGTGRTSVLLHLLAAATAVGEWTAVVAGPAGFPGPRAAAEAGVELSRLAFVRAVPAARWATVVATLLDGCTAVLADAPGSLAPADARRLVARVRERRAVLLTGEGWPERAQRRVRVLGGDWRGLDEGRLGERQLRLEVLDRSGWVREAHLGELAAVG